MHHPTDRITHTTAFVTSTLAGTRNSSIGSTMKIRRPIAPWANALTTELHLAREQQEITQWVHPMKNRSDDPSHHERTLLPRSYISFQETAQWVHHEGSIRRPIAPWANALTTELRLAPRGNEWMNEWMFNDTPARKTDRHTVRVR